MTADDKCGIGAGLLALGLAGGLILLAQVLPANVMPSFFPHRDLVKIEAICDGLVFITCLPAGIYFLVRGAVTEPSNDEKDQ